MLNNYLMIFKKNVGIFIILSLLFFGCTEKDSVYLVRNGRTNYNIYLDPFAPEHVKFAAEELEIYFKKVAGISPAIIIAENPPSPPFISLGYNSAVRDAGFDPSVIPNDGFRIVTKEKNLYIFGPDTPAGEVNKLGGVNKGTANGVLTFIEDYLGVEWLMAGEIGEHYKKVKSISLPLTDRTDFSPFNYRVQSFRMSGPLDQEWDRRLKLAKVAAVSHSHSWAQTIPASLYAKHPGWFAEVQGKHLPPSGTYKLETTNPELVQAFADTIIARFRRDPDLRWHSLSPADGSYGWSDSKASMALIEKDPFGNISRTPLILKFYNDVAKIVGKEFPDHKLGGYIYAMYLYPPTAGVPKLEPNLALVVATSISYGYQLYRPSTRENWDNLMRTWGESAKKDGFDLYYYDLPTSIMQPNGILWPPAPDILNFIFSRLIKYGFKGAYVYGNPVWPVFGAGNYVLAKLQWNPEQDATKLLQDYYKSAYGDNSAPYIEQLFNVLDTAWNKFMNAHPRASFSLTEDHLKEIYGPNYEEIEGIYLKAKAVKKEAKQQQRIDLFGQVLSLMQWNLKKNGLLAEDYNSALTLGDEDIDHILSNQQNDARITRGGSIIPENIFAIEILPPLADAKTRGSNIIPVYRNIRMLLYAEKKREINIYVRTFNGRGEFVPFTVSSSDGKQILAGGMYEGRKISFNTDTGESYLLDISSRGAIIKLEVEGAAIAYKSNLLSNTFQLAAGSAMEVPVALYFFRPEELKNFSLTLGTRGAVAEIYSPSGRLAGKLDCTHSTAARIDFKEDNIKSGFWKIIFHKIEAGSISFTMDENLSPWLIPDPEQPMVIITDKK